MQNKIRAGNRACPAAGNGGAGTAGVELLREKRKRWEFRQRLDSCKGCLDLDSMSSTTLAGQVHLRDFTSFKNPLLSGSKEKERDAFPNPGVQIKP